MKMQGFVSALALSLAASTADASGLYQISGTNAVQSVASDGSSVLTNGVLSGNLQDVTMTLDGQPVALPNALQWAQITKSNTNGAAQIYLVGESTYDAWVQQTQIPYRPFDPNVSRGFCWYSSGFLAPASTVPFGFDDFGTSKLEVDVPNRAWSIKLYLRDSADFDFNGTVDMVDLMSFLEDWFAGKITGDADKNDQIDLLDIFAFLETWFAGE